jgi:ubiquinone/menaquinone biosynthesis C-methylase UbiE
LDLSVNLLKIAKQRGPQIQLVRGDMRFLPFKPTAFCAAVSMDTSFGYLPSEEETGSLAEVRRVLRRGSKFIFDVFNRENLIAKHKEKAPSTKQRDYPSFRLLEKQTVSEKGDWRCDTWEIHDKLSGKVKVFEHIVRLYKRERLERLFANAGFEVSAVFGGYEQQTFNVEASQLILIAAAC